MTRPIFFAQFTTKVSSLSKIGLFATLILILVLSSGIGQANASSNPALTVNPAFGPVGTEITVKGEGFPSGATVDLVWHTVVGRWVVPAPTREFDEHEHGEIIAHGHDFLGSEFFQKNFTVSSVSVDGVGSFTLRIRAPYDFAGRHDISAVVRGAGKNAVKNVFTMIPSFTISPTSGPVGTKITIQGYGLGWSVYETNYHVLYDDKYVGYATAITTQGNATFQVYATGDVGTHYIDIYSGYPGPAYLNPQESPVKRFYKVPWRFTFTVTPTSEETALRTGESLGLGSLSLVMAVLALSSFRFSENVRRKIPKYRFLVLTLTSAAIILAAITLGITAGGSMLYVRASPQASIIEPYRPLEELKQASINPDLGAPTLLVSPKRGVVGSNITISGVGFPSGASVELLWTTKKGSYLTGWDDVVLPLGTRGTDSRGSFTFSMKVPHDLEGPHEVGARIKGVNATVKNAAFSIIRSTSINATSVRAGDIIEIRMKGVGWTFVTNTATFVHDNTYAGYGCGFNSLGNVTVYLKAVGKPGLHTIDIYPTIYDGPPQGKSNSIYRYPLLTPEDHPAKIRAFHFEYIITESDHRSQDSSDALTPQNVSVMTIAVGAFMLALHTKTSLQANSRRPK